MEMKTRLFSIPILLIVSSLSILPCFAQDFSQSGLPEGAEARLGKGAISEIAYAPDGTRLVVASSIGIWIYDAQTGEALDLLTGHTSSVYSVSFSPDGQTIATGSEDDTVLLWNLMPPSPTHLPEDVNGDGKVNIQDLVAVAVALGETGETPADVNGDGKVNIQDLVAVNAALGETAASAP